MEIAELAAELPLQLPKRPKVYTTREYEPLAVALSELVDAEGRLRLNPDVEAKGYFTIQLTRGKVRLQARGFVGLIPLNDHLVIDVRPRVPVANLPRLLRISEYLPPYLQTERAYATDPTWNESLIDVFAGWFAAQVDRVASGGLLQVYERQEETSSFPHGRIQIDRTLKRLRPRGIHHKVVSSWFDRSADNPANRCLKYALWFLAGRLSRLEPRTTTRRQILQRLTALYELFAPVPLDHSLSFLNDPLVTGAQSLPSLRHYYRPALDLGKTIIRNHALDLEAKSRVLGLPSMVLDMEKIFEGYLRNLLRFEASREDWGLAVLDGNTTGKKLLFDDPPSEDATPDIVCRGRDGHWPLLVEVKNIPVKGNSSRDAIEQAVTYAATYRCDQVVLAHPRSRNQDISGLRLQGKIGELCIYQYVFDLKASDLEAEERRFCVAIGRLSGGHGHEDGT